MTGGAGFLGVSLARLLAARGWGVVSLDIAEVDDADLRPSVRSIRGDIRDPTAVARAVAGVDAVVHAAAALPLHAAADIRSTEVDGTRRVLEGALDAGVRRFVHISSTAVYGIPSHAPLVETDALEGVGPYGEAKIEAEGVCADFRSMGLTTSVLRPATFVGPERLGVFDLLFDWALDGRHFPLLGGGRNRYQMLHVADLCEAVFACLTGPRETVNDTFNVGAREFGTLGSDCQAVLDEAGHGRRIVGLPAAPAMAVLRVLHALHLSPVYPWIYETAVRDCVASVEKAGRVLGWAPKHSNRAALVANFRWYREARPGLPSSPGLTHRTRWKQGALGLVRRLF